MKVRFTWNTRKSEKTRAARGIDFEVASRVFHDPHLQYFEDRVIAGEERIHAVGYVAGYGVLVVTHIAEEEEHGEHIHIISARFATPAEERNYHQDR